MSDDESEPETERPCPCEWFHIGEADDTPKQASQIATPATARLDDVAMVPDLTEDDEESEEEQIINCFPGITLPNLQQAPSTSCLVSSFLIGDDDDECCPLIGDDEDDRLDAPLQSTSCHASSLFIGDDDDACCCFFIGDDEDDLIAECDVGEVNTYLLEPNALEQAGLEVVANEFLFGSLPRPPEAERCSGEHQFSARVWGEVVPLWPRPAGEPAGAIAPHCPTTIGDTYLPSETKAKEEMPLQTGDTDLPSETKEKEEMQACKMVCEEKEKLIGKLPRPPELETAMASSDANAATDCADGYTCELPFGSLPRPPELEKVPCVHVLPVQTDPQVEITDEIVHVLPVQTHLSKASQDPDEQNHHVGFGLICQGTRTLNELVRLQALHTQHVLADCVACMLFCVSSADVGMHWAQSSVHT